MKKKLLIALAFFLLCFVVLIIGVSGDDPLSPSAEKALSFQLQVPPPEDNIYVGIAGLGRIEDGDVVVAGEKFLKGRPKFDPEPQGQFDFSYRNPCLWPKEPASPGGDEKVDDFANCLDQIVAEARAIDESLEKNAVIIERYRAVQKMPLFVNTTTSTDDPVPMYQRLIDSTRLLGAKALLDIKQGRLAAGLEALEAEIIFYKKIATSEQVSLIDMMIAVAGLSINLGELSKIIEDPQIDLTGQENRLRQMLDLNLNANQMMITALKSEKRQSLSGFSKMAEVWLGQDMSLEDRLRLNFFKFLYKRNMTLNLIAARMDANIQGIEATPALGFPDFIAANKEAELKAMEEGAGMKPTVKELYDRYGLFFFKNYTGEILANMARPLFLSYLVRINDITVHSRLLRAGLELRLMDNRPEDLSEALAGLGPEMWNPYTGQPFNWDRERKTIWGEKAGSTGAADPLSRRMEVRI